MTMTWPVDVEISELRRELAQERRALIACERAEFDHRICDRDRWMAQLERRRQRIAEKEALLNDLLPKEGTE